MTAVKCIGHGGASAVVRPNTLESFDAAVDLGAHMIEFDVRASGRRLVLAHTRLHNRLRPLGLEDALEHLGGRRFGDLDFNVDVKHPGIEEPVLEAVERHGLLDRALFSSQCVKVLDNIRRHEPRARVGISVGGRLARSSQRWWDWRRKVLDALAARRFDALMAQHRLVDEDLLARVRECGAELYAWTVGDSQTLARLRALGVDGITTGDPRLFDAASA